MSVSADTTGVCVPFIDDQVEHWLIQLFHFIFNLLLNSADVSSPESLLGLLPPKFGRQSLVSWEST